MSKLDDLLQADHRDVVMTKLEAFSDHFVYLARTKEQRELASAFKAFVGEFIREFSPQLDEVDLQAVHAKEPKAAWKESGHDSVASLFAEMRTDETAGKREDAHGYGKETLKQILEGKTEKSIPELTKDSGMER